MARIIDMISYLDFSYKTRTYIPVLKILFEGEKTLYVETYDRLRRVRKYEIPHNVSYELKAPHGTIETQNLTSKLYKLYKKYKKY